MNLTHLNKSDLTTRYKIDGMPKDKDYEKMPFGRRIEYRHQIEAFKQKAKSTHISQKRRHHTTAIREFIKLNDVTQYYCCFNARDDYYDDSFEIWYI